VDLVAIADPSEEMALGAPTKSSCTATIEHVDREKPALVTVAVPTAQHAEVVQVAISRGIHVLVEKLIALTHAEGNRSSIWPQRRGQVYGSTSSANPQSHRDQKRKLDDEALTSVRLAPYSVPRPHPRRGYTLDLATHDIDAMRYLRAEVERLYTQRSSVKHTSCEDLLTGLLRLITVIGCST